MASLLDMLDGNQSQAPHSAFGDVFGGAGNSMIAPYLGQQGLNAARNNTLMSIGAAMLQAGAPSTDPSHGSFGAALGAGALGGINAYQNSINRGMQSVNAAQQMQMGKLNLAKQLMLMKLASGLAGGATDTVSQQAPSSQQSGNPSSSPMPSSSVPITTGNSGGNLPSQPSGESGAQSDLNPLGMPNNLAAMYMLSNPNGYLQQQGSAFAPTDLIKNMRAGGINPSSNTGKAYLDNYLQKQGYIAPITVRQGTSVYDPVNRKWIGFNPMTAQGTAPVRDENGNVIGIQALPGAASTAQQMEAAKSIGHAAGQLVDVTGPDGATYKVPATTLLQNQQQIGDDGRLQPPLPNGQTGVGSSAPLPGMVGLSNQSALSPASLAAQTQTGKTSATQLAQDRELAGNYATRMFQLQQAYNGLQNSDTGPGSHYVNQSRSFLMSQGPQFLQNLGIVNPEKVASYDEANKYLTQYAMSQAGALGNGTDQKLATVLSGNANTHISNLAAQDVVRANMALEAMKQAAIRQFSQSGQPPEKYSQWRTDFESKIDPRVFAWDLMPADKQVSAYKSMSKPQQFQFLSQYNWAKRNNLLPQVQ